MPSRRSWRLSTRSWRITPYAAESYDAANLIALAAIAGKNDSRASISQNIQAVSGGSNEGRPAQPSRRTLPSCRPGRRSTTRGNPDPSTLMRTATRSRATMGVYVFGPDNKHTPKDFVTADVPRANGRQRQQ